MMEYRPFHQYQISRITLGTVQLGMPYGIANIGGMPEKAESFKILDTATAAGITAFDSAHSYGEAETILGDYFDRLDEKKHLLITKARCEWGSGYSVDSAWKDLELQVMESLKKLRVSQIPLLLYHKGMHETSEIMDEIVPRLLERLKDINLVQHTGLSCASSEDVRAFALNPVYEAVQIPINIFDLSHLTDGTLEKLHRAGKFIFARSIFLQGLFFKTIPALQGKMEDAIPFLTQVKKLADQFRLTIPELVFGFVRDIPEIDSLVIGAENHYQIYADLKLLSGPRLPDTLRQVLTGIAGSIPRKVFTPALWSG